jgi:PAS domain S-box-containing protein
MTVESSEFELERLRAAVESAPTGLVVLDATGRIVLANGEVERLFGFARSDLLGMRVDHLVPDPVRQMGAPRELFARTRTGAAIPIEMAMSTVEIDGTTFVVASVADVSQRKRTEAEREETDLRLRHSQRLESLGRLANGVAHELDRVLGTIQGLSESALVEPEAAEAYLEGIQRATQRGRDFLERMLVFARGRGVSLGPVHLGRAVSDAIDSVRLTWPEGLHLDVSTPAVSPLVRSDRAAIRLIVDNLLTNAAHASYDGGHVSIHVSRVDLDADFVRTRPGLREGGYGRLLVSDTGMGMDAAARTRCFEPFFTTKGRDGAGMGLAMVHGIVQDLSGAVWIDSALGKGTVVTVLIPVVHEATW